MTRFPMHPSDESTLIELAHGLLPAGRREEVLAHLHECAECEHRFRAIVAEREHFRATLHTRLASPAVKWTLPLRKPAWIAAAACAVLIAVIVVARWQSPETQREYWIPVGEESMVLRSVDGSTRPDQVRGVLDDYTRHNATAAVKSLETFEAAPGDVTSAALRDLFLASALLNAGRPAESEAALQRLSIDTLPPQWRRQARWIRYLALTALDRDAEAQPLLDVLMDEPGEIGVLAREERERIR